MHRLLLALVAFGYVELAVAAEATKPNVVIIYTDDQGFGDVSSLNGKAKFETPNYDRLARESLGSAVHRLTCDQSVCVGAAF